MREDETHKGLYRDIQDIDMDSIQYMINEMAIQESKYKLQMLLFISRGNPIAAFEEWHRHDFEITAVEKRDFHEIQLERRIEREDIEDGGRRISGSFGLWRYGDTDVWVAFTSESPDFFKYGLIRFIESYRPRLSRVYLTSSELKDVFVALERKLSREIWVTKTVVRSHHDSASIVFDKRPYLDMFNSPDLEGRYVDKIEFLIKGKGREEYHGFISRDGTCFYNYGKVEYFFKFILPTVVTRGKEKFDRFEGIERVSGSGSVDPVFLSFGQDLLVDREANVRLAEALSGIQRAAIAIYHLNPYLHVSLVDFFDGSTLDIISDGPERVGVYPGYNCSFHALMRVSEEISRNFYEGSIVEAPRRRYELSDFLGA